MIVRIHRFDGGEFIRSVSKIVTFIQYHPQTRNQGGKRGRDNEAKRGEMSKSGGRILMGGSPRTWSGGLFRQQFPGKGGPSFPKGQGFRVEHEAWSRRGTCGGGRGLGSRAQMPGFCFLDILLSTCEGPCAWAHGHSACIWRPDRKETISWTPTMMEQHEEVRLPGCNSTVTPET